MNTKLNILLLIIGFLFHSQLFAQNPNFTGTWVLNFEKSNLDKSDNLIGLTGQIFVIKQDSNKFSLKIYHMYGDKKKKIGFKMVADGKTRKVKILFKGKLEKKENSLQATMWRKNYPSATRSVRSSPRLTNPTLRVRQSEMCQLLNRCSP